MRRFWTATHTYFDVHHNSFWYTSKRIMIYIKTGNILGFQFAPVPLPPFRTFLFIRGSGWNPLFTPLMTHLSSRNHGHLSCKPQAFEELRCEVWEVEVRHWNYRNCSLRYGVPPAIPYKQEGSEGWKGYRCRLKSKNILCFDVYHNSFWYTSKWTMIYIKNSSLPAEYFLHRMYICLSPLNFYWARLEHR